MIAVRAAFRTALSNASERSDAAAKTSQLRSAAFAVVDFAFVIGEVAILAV